MKNLLATLFAALALFLFNPASASTADFGVTSVDKFAQPLICAEDGDKKKKEGEVEEEPECE